jgi:hypothetical protein
MQNQTLSRIDNAMLLAYIMNDDVIIKAVQKLRGHLNKAYRDFEQKRICIEDLNATEMGVLNKIGSIFSR